MDRLDDGRGRPARAAKTPGDLQMALRLPSLMHACDPAPPWLDASPDHPSGFKPGGNDGNDAGPDLHPAHRVCPSTPRRCPRTSRWGR